MPAISIIIPVYNVEKYLRQCLDSVLAQTYTDWECILVDDGSPDNSGVICDEYAHKDGRIKAFHQTNAGVSAARNKGIEEARGELIYFMDADDKMEVNGLTTLVERMGDDVGLVMALHRTYDEDGELLHEYVVEPDTKWDISEVIQALYYGWKGSYQGYLWTKLFKAAVIRKHHLRFDENISFNEDRLFIIRYLCVQPCRVSFTSHVVYNYFQRKSSAMMSLGRAFNYKFLTDLYAYEHMFENVRTLHSPRLNLTAKVGIYTSARNIRHMARKFAIKDEQAVCAEVEAVVKRNLGILSRLYAYYRIVLRPKIERYKNPRVAIPKAVRKLKKIIGGGGGKIALKIKDNGHNNKVIIPKKLSGGILNIVFYGSNNLVIIGERCKLKMQNRIFVQGDYNKVILAENVTFDQNVLLVACEGTKISLGSDCIVANGVTIRTSDQHGIYDSEGDRINPAKDVHIGNHVWLGASAVVMKGVSVGDGCVIGLGSMVTKNIAPHCIAVGTPARIIKENISWSEELKTGIALPI